MTTPAVIWSVEDATEISATLLITTALTGEDPTGTRPASVERHTASVPPVTLTAKSPLPPG